MLFYTLTVRQDSYAESLYQRGLGLTLLQENSKCRSYVSVNQELMLVVVSVDIASVEPKRCRGHVMYPVASEAEVDQLFRRALSMGAVSLMSPRRTAQGFYSGYLHDEAGYLWEITANNRLLSQS